MIIGITFSALVEIAVSSFILGAIATLIVQRTFKKKN